MAFKNIASLDIGSHTARMLVSQWEEGAPRLRPLLRRRAYIRLAEEFEIPERETIKPSAVDRTVRVLNDFITSAGALGVAEMVAVATGVVREARNQEDFLRAIRDQTGIEVRIIPGEEEAFLTGLGVRHALRILDEPFVIFDLGGGTTEFLIGARGGTRYFSLPLGAAIFTHRFFRSDPPADREIAGLEREIDAVLEPFHGLDPLEGRVLVGTGGTVTTLASLIHKIGFDEISPERMNGLTLAMADLEPLLRKMEKMKREERVELLGLETERAEVILAGFLTVMVIMRRFRSSELKVSLSDLLEGTLIRYVGGAGGERGFATDPFLQTDGLS